MTTTFRTDRNNNPVACTTDVAHEGGLVFGTDYVEGDPFTVGTSKYFTAKFLGDPVALSIKLIDTATFYTKIGQIRWTYIAIPKFLWDTLLPSQRVRVIKFMYEREGGTAMLPLFQLQ